MVQIKDPRFSSFNPKLRESWATHNAAAARTHARRVEYTSREQGRDQKLNWHYRFARLVKLPVAPALQGPRSSQVHGERMKSGECAAHLALRVKVSCPVLARRRELVIDALELV